MSSPDTATSSEGRNLRYSGVDLQRVTWDYHFMNQWFPRKIRPTDLDCVVEMSGNFLVIEFESVFKTHSNGQEWALRSLSGKDSFTVLRVSGHAPNTVMCWEQIGGPAKGSGPESLEAFVREWTKGK